LIADQGTQAKQWLDNYGNGYQFNGEQAKYDANTMPHGDRSEMIFATSNEDVTKIQMRMTHSMMGCSILKVICGLADNHPIAHMFQFTINNLSNAGKSLRMLPVPSYCDEVEFFK